MIYCLSIPELETILKALDALEREDERMVELTSPLRRSLMRTLEEEQARWAFIQENSIPDIDDEIQKIIDGFKSACISGGDPR